MSNADRRALTELAGAILDGTPIDWDAADSGLSPEDRSILGNLKAVAAIARAQRVATRECWGPLRLLERVGEGAFGEVYRAWDSRLDREVALKLLPAAQVSSSPLAASIIEEGRLLARVRHPNVVTVYGAEQIDDRVGLWMEYIDGRTLHQLVVEDKRRFSAREAAAIGYALCGAVAAVHAAGLLHRDIKAQNVMMAPDGRIALMDFGTGREQREQANRNVAGTPLYLAPEVLVGEGSASVQADIYSMGVLLFFLLTGSYPVTGSDVAGLREAHRLCERRPLDAGRPDVPRWLRRVIERAIDPDPGRRYASAAAMGNALGYARPPGWKAVSAGVAAAALIVVVLVTDRWSGTASAPPERTSIAVLPLAAARPADEDDAQFAEGLTNEIIRNLGVVRGLEVRSPATSAAFAATHQDIAEIGRRLDVGYVVEGSVARDGDRLRVDARLVKADDQSQVWADKFERDLTVHNILAIQDEISRAVVGSLKLTLVNPQRRYATNLVNYELYLRARALAERQGFADPLRAVSLFNKVIDSDPQYAPAHAGIVLAYANLSMSPYQGVSFEQAHAVMRPAAIEAVRLDPTLADAHVARGWVHAREYEWAEAEKAFRHAIELNPGLIFIYTSFTRSTLQPLGRVTDAEQLLREAERIDPYSVDVQRELGRILVQANRPGEAISILERLRHTDSDLPFLELHLGRALTLQGRAADALPLLERHRQRLLEPGAGPDPWVAWAYVQLGRRADAEALAGAYDHLPFRRAVIHGALGNVDRMFDGLEEMARSEPQRVLTLLQTPELVPHRHDERFKRLLRRFNVPAD